MVRHGSVDGVWAELVEYLLARGAGGGYGAQGGAAAGSGSEVSEDGAGGGDGCDGSEAGGRGGRGALAKFGRIDVLVNNAGYGMVGAMEESGEEEFRPMFETNVFGLIRVTQAVLPQMREQGSGHIVNLSSIGGLVATPGCGLYNATKFAVEGLSEALAQEMEPLGIPVTIVEPGPFRTEFLGRRGRGEEEDCGVRGDCGQERDVFHGRRMASSRAIRRRLWRRL